MGRARCRARPAPAGPRSWRRPWPSDHDRRGGQTGDGIEPSHSLRVVADPVREAEAAEVAGIGWFGSWSVHSPRYGLERRLRVQRLAYSSSVGATIHLVRAARLAQESCLPGGLETIGESFRYSSRQDSCGDLFPFKADTRQSENAGPHRSRVARPYIQGDEPGDEHREVQLPGHGLEDASLGRVRSPGTDVAVAQGREGHEAEIDRACAQQPRSTVDAAPKDAGQVLSSPSSSHRTRDRPGGRRPAQRRCARRPPCRGATRSAPLTPSPARWPTPTTPGPAGRRTGGRA